MTTGDIVQLSIIVACRNEGRHIRIFLDSLLAQEMCGLTWEAIIADGMSDDGTREILQEYIAHHPEVRMIDNPRRVVSPGLNAAIRAACGAVVIRMDAHTSYAPDYCRRCVAELERTGADNVGGPARTRTHGTRARLRRRLSLAVFDRGQVPRRQLRRLGGHGTVRLLAQRDPGASGTLR